MSWVNEFKSFGWVKAIGLAITAVLLALAAARASNLRINAERKEDRATDMLNSGISKEIQKGKKLTESAQVDKDKAVDARAKVEAQLDKLGKANEDLDDIADRFNSRRLRKRT